MDSQLNKVEEWVDINLASDEKKEFSAPEDCPAASAAQPSDADVRLALENKYRVFLNQQTARALAYFADEVDSGEVTADLAELSTRTPTTSTTDAK